MEELSLIGGVNQSMGRVYDSGGPSWGPSDLVLATVGTRTGRSWILQIREVVSVKTRAQDHRRSRALPLGRPSRPACKPLYTVASTSACSCSIKMPRGKDGTNEQVERECMVA